MQAGESDAGAPSSAGSIKWVHFGPATHASQGIGSVWLGPKASRTRHRRYERARARSSAIRPLETMLSFALKLSLLAVRSFRCHFSAFGATLQPARRVERVHLRRRAVCVGTGGRTNFEREPVSVLLGSIL